EPLIAEHSLSAEAAAALVDDVSFALLMALERLSPLERAAFLLHDVFDMEFDEIAQVLGRSAASSPAGRVPMCVLPGRVFRWRRRRARGWPRPSSRPPAAATPPPCRTCWPRPRCSIATAAAASSRHCG